MDKYSLMLLLLSMFLINCGSGETSEDVDNDSLQYTFGANFTNYDLSQYEIPVVVAAPIGAEIKAGVGNGAFGGVRTINYEIIKGDFILDVNHIVGAKYSKENLITSEKLFAEELEGFEGFISEEENGFIYKVKTNEGEDYGFYYVIFKGEEPIEFGVGFSYTNFTLEEVKNMYKVAKAAK